ncbi:MAG: ribonuclease E activity regulator RraA [Rhodospirillales bacterium]|nr:ribonuclease E activity regulator RraA [Rhodospirillales bacterium]
MTTGKDIIYTADICDDHPEARVCELAFVDFAKRTHFHGRVVTFSTYEDFVGVSEILKQDGQGKVLVIDGRGSRRRALCGGNVAGFGFENNWAGIVINGCIRDQHEINELDFGVKALGSTPMRPRSDGIGKAGISLNFGGIAIHPGDYLYADADGVIVLKDPA